ncbi:S-adenosyl-L-methionine-dependent methyltransferase [Schizopora paradoxa]|uniref:DNA (cytosine-5-)-methyltransferase n=1 Tax=Schizopora paradoxa TaxID=27342 RepID=A0A0H2S775_9AGAM|nr:S-adenosyl-L-methionine-dependent methyltransferase [Schizopora paradoxa]
MAAPSNSRFPKRTTAADLFEAHPFAKVYTPDEDAKPQIPEPEDEPAPDYPRLDEVPLHNDHLNPTCVTPFIAELAAPYFADLEVAGMRLPKGLDGPYERKLLHSPVYKHFLQDLLDAHHRYKLSTVDWKNCVAVRASGRRSRQELYKQVKIEDKMVQVGDIVIIARGSSIPNTPAAPLPKNIKDHPGAHAGNLFWFAKVLSIRREDNTFHGQWFEHGSQTVLEELAHPQELFLTNLCDDIKLSAILSHCICRRLPPGERPRPQKVEDETKFFYSLMYDRKYGAFMDIDDKQSSVDEFLTCTLCKARNAEKSKPELIRIRDRRRLLEGFSYLGEDFHYADGVMISSETGLCLIGQILGLPKGRCTGDFWITVRLFGRMTKRMDLDRADGVGLYEDRRLFLSDVYLDVCSTEIVGKCYILPESPEMQLKTWVQSSPTHFYFSHFSKTLEYKNGSSPLIPHSDDHEFILCGYCMEREQTHAGELKNFIDRLSEEPLRVFDPFAGVGAFALSMCGNGSFKFTHACEIDVSAARTIKKNSPDTVVYNQCSNLLLKAATLNGPGKHLTGDLEDLESLDPSLREEGPLPPLPTPDQIDCIVSGFPCQPHSSMNMYAKSRDRQNELFLNTISWVDLMKPKYCIFENVKGFIRYRLGATQDGPHRVAEGTPLGGLKLIMRALVSMGYQARFGLLQAACYGTPQSRVRFFLIAAKSGHRLPNFPKPTHEFTPNNEKQKNSNSICFPIAGSITAIEIKSGFAPMPGNTIKDAIEDLRRFDWKNPHKVYSRQESPGDPPERRGVIKVKCNSETATCCGPSLRHGYYEHPAYTAFQAFCRSRDAADVQHITLCFDDATVERAVNISLAARADYHTLLLKNMAKLLDQYQMIDPTSANARHGFKAGMYGRLGEHEIFYTIVTNIRPTAKQSWVMNPWDHRIYSVRELARAQGFPDHFEFVTDDDQSVTKDNLNILSMHRGIGNAVPWPVGDALSKELIGALFMEKEGANLQTILDRHDRDWLEVHASARSNL